MRVDVSAEAGECASGRGGRLWIWAAHPRVCCWGTPAYMHAATVLPAGLSGFSPAHADGLEVGSAPLPGGCLASWRSGCAGDAIPGRGLLGRLLLRPVIGSPVIGAL